MRNVNSIYRLSSTFLKLASVGVLGTGPYAIAKALAILYPDVKTDVKINELMHLGKENAKKEVNATFRKLALIYHPDIASDTKSQTATEESSFMEINEAKEILLKAIDNNELKFALIYQYSNPQKDSLTGPKPEIDKALKILFPDMDPKSSRIRLIKSTPLEKKRILFKAFDERDKVIELRKKEMPMLTHENYAMSKALFNAYELLENEVENGTYFKLTSSFSIRFDDQIADEEIASKVRSGFLPKPGQQQETVDFHSGIQNPMISGFVSPPPPKKARPEIQGKAREILENLKVCPVDMSREEINIGSYSIDLRASTKDDCKPLQNLGNILDYDEVGVYVDGLPRNEPPSHDGFKDILPDVKSTTHSERAYENYFPNLPIQNLAKLINKILLHESEMVEVMEAYPQLFGHSIEPEREHISEKKRTPDPKNTKFVDPRTNEQKIRQERNNIELELNSAVSELFGIEHYLVEDKRKELAASPDAIEEILNPAVEEAIRRVNKLYDRREIHSLVELQMEYDEIHRFESVIYKAIDEGYIDPDLWDKE